MIRSLYGGFFAKARLVQLLAIGEWIQAIVPFSSEVGIGDWKVQPSYFGLVFSSPESEAI